MTTIKFPFKINLNHFALFALLGIFSTYGCQPDRTQDLQPESNLEIQNDDVLTTKKLILEYNFRMPTQSLSDEEVEVLYDETMAKVPEGKEEEMVAFFNQLNTQIETYSAEGQAIGVRSGETLLSNGVGGDGFGQGVAYASNKVYVGAPGENKVNWYTKSGSFLGEITPDGASDDFGWHVSVSGNFMAVAAPDFGQPFGRPGQVFVFKRQGNDWVQQAILTGPAGENNFGGDGLKIQGSRIYATSRGSGFPSPGSTISIFKRSGNNWVLESSILEPGRDWFALDVHESGNIIVGTGSLNNSLAVVRATVFTKSGTSWNMTDDVTITGPTPFSVALPRDVSISYNYITLTSLIPGNKAWVIGKSGSSWALNQELALPGFGAPFNNRWTSVDRNEFVVGMASNNNVIPDQVHRFKRFGSNWNFQETYTPSDGADVTMWDVELSRGTTVVGLPDSEFAPVTGKAYIFD